MTQAVTLRLRLRPRPSPRLNGRSHLWSYPRPRTRGTRLCRDMRGNIRGRMRRKGRTDRAPSREDEGSNRMGWYRFFLIPPPLLLLLLILRLVPLFLVPRLERALTCMAWCLRSWFNGSGIITSTVSFRPRTGHYAFLPSADILNKREHGIFYLISAGVGVYPVPKEPPWGAPI